MSLDLDSATKHLLNVGKGLLGVVVGMLAFLVVVVPFVMIRGCDQNDPGTNEARRLERLEILEEIQAQDDELVAVKYLDEENGVVHLPIENAMAVVIEQFQEKEVTRTDLKAEWIPPQLPAWAKQEPLYTLARPEDIENLTTEIDQQAQAEAAAESEIQPDAGAATEIEPREGSPEARQRDDMEAESANFGQQPVAGDELGAPHSDTPPADPVVEEPAQEN